MKKVLGDIPCEVVDRHNEGVLFVGLEVVVGPVHYEGVAALGLCEGNNDPNCNFFFGVGLEDVNHEQVDLL